MVENQRLLSLYDSVWNVFYACICFYNCALVRSGPRVRNIFLPMQQMKKRKVLYSSDDGGGLCHEDNYGSCSLLACTRCAPGGIEKALFDIAGMQLVMMKDGNDFTALHSAFFGVGSYNVMQILERFGWLPNCQKARKPESQPNRSPSHCQKAKLSRM